MYSATTGLLCAVGWLLLWRMKRLTAPVLRFDLDVLVVGCIVGIGVSIVTSIVWIAMGHSIGFSFSAAKALGDAFSNMYEEISYRGLLFGAALYSMRRPALAMLFSGAVFAYTHQQYPLAFQVLIVFVGAAFAFGYMRTGSLWAAWVAHQFSDVVLDTILQS